MITDVKIDNINNIITVIVSETYNNCTFSISKTAGIIIMSGYTLTETIKYMSIKMSLDCQQKILEEIKNSVFVKEIQ